MGWTHGAVHPTIIVSIVKKEQTYEDLKFWLLIEKESTTLAITICKMDL